MVKKTDKKIEKKMVGLAAYSHFVDEFKQRAAYTTGSQGEQLSAALMAFMALNEIDEGLTSRLANPDLNVEKATSLILSSMLRLAYERALSGLSEKEQAEILRKGLLLEKQVFGNQ